MEEARFRVFGDVASDYRGLVMASDAVVISIIKTRASTENMVYGSEEYNAVVDTLDELQTDYETAGEAVKEKKSSLSLGIHMLNQTKRKKSRCTGCADFLLGGRTGHCRGRGSRRRLRASRTCRGHHHLYGGIRR